MIKKYFKLLSLLLLLPATVALQSCLVATKDTMITPEIKFLYEGEYKVDPYMNDHLPKSVAVLPFVDLSGSKEGFDVVRRGFYNHFSSLPFKDMKLYRVDNTLRKAGLVDPAAISKMSPQKLGKMLDVDAVVFGEISNFDKLYAVVYSQVSVGAQIKMYDTKTGKFLWSGKNVARIHGGGIATNPVGIIATVISTAMNVREIQLLRANDDLFRDMVRTIPVPRIAEMLRPPVITLLTQDSKGQPKKAGDEIKVVIKGTPKMLAYFDIGDSRKNIEMQEVESGGYYGVYKVVPGDNIEKAIITGYLRDDSGNTAQWVDAVSSVTLLTNPPVKPRNASAVGRNSLVLLNWEKISAPYLAGYKIYRSNTPLSGYVEIAKTEVNEYRDPGPGLVNSQKYFYRISAHDVAGNESEMAQVTGMPIAPGPTMVSGTIEADTVWYSGASPYIMEKDVKIKDKSLLTIEPGTEIKSRGSALIIEGRLKAEGDNDHIINFDTATEGQSWPGIVFADVKDKENTVKFVRLKNAKIAVNCQDSSPKIEMSEFTQNNEVLKIQGAFSKPEIKKNSIYKNKDVALSVSDGAAPVIMENTIQDNENTGLLISSATPEFVQNILTGNKNNGIIVKGTGVNISRNNIVDNKPFNIVGSMTGTSIKALDNWWGSSKILEVLAGIQGRVDISTVLDSAYPQGKSITITALGKNLAGVIKTDSYLVLSNSPYRVTRDVIIDGGATLYIEPGVIIEFEQKTSLITADGGIIARGTKENPIVFTAAASSPTPGFYNSAVRLFKQSRINSFFTYCIIKYATTAFDIYAGAPEISYSQILNSSQNAVFCRNDAAPIITYNTFIENSGEGAIKCVGMANPRIKFNNFIGNTVAIQSFSTIYIDARNNWWGANPPDQNMIWGDNINIKPWLTKKEPRAFKEKNKM
ncbi:MAG: GNA1162 family protein [Smithella sp.]